PAGRIYFDFEVMPFAVGVEVRWPVPNSVLMAKFQSNTFEDIVHFSGVLGEESFATRHGSNIIEDRLAIRGELSVSWFFYPDRVDDYVRLFHKAPQLIEGVSRVIVLSIANHQESALRMSAVRDLVDT